MQKFTRAQLIAAMTLYNQEVKENPEKFNGQYETSEEAAVSQIDYLLALIPAE